MKNNVMILGDSYSTYEGYIPEGYSCYYRIHREDPPFIHGVEKTWWRIFAKENDINIVMNDSYSGSTVCNTVRENYEISSSFISRIDKYIAEGFFEEHHITEVDDLITAWDTFTKDLPGESLCIHTNGKDIYDIPDMLKDYGIYLARQREE